MFGRSAQLAGLSAAKYLTDIVKTSLAGKPHGQDLSHKVTNSTNCTCYKLQQFSWTSATSQLTLWHSVEQVYLLSWTSVSLPQKEIVSIHASFCNWRRNVKSCTRFSKKKFFCPIDGPFSAKLILHLHAPIFKVFYIQVGASRVQIYHSYYMNH